MIGCLFFPLYTQEHKKRTIADNQRKIRTKEPTSTVPRKHPTGRYEKQTTKKTQIKDLKCQNVFNLERNGNEKKTKPVTTIWIQHAAECQSSSREFLLKLTSSCTKAKIQKQKSNLKFQTFGRKFVTDSRHLCIYFKKKNNRELSTVTEAIQQKKRYNHLMEKLFKFKRISTTFGPPRFAFHVVRKFLFVIKWI